jgi:hypothetical protein
MLYILDTTVVRLTLRRQNRSSISAVAHLFIRLYASCSHLFVIRPFESPPSIYTDSLVATT